MRILLVEDDKDVAAGIIQGLEQQGYKVEHCANCAQTKAALSTDKFGAAIFDLGLPDGESMPLIKQIKSEPEAMPIIVLTAWDDIEKKLTALNMGADDYVVKPFDIRELEARIRVVVRRSQARQNDQISHGLLSIDLNNHSCEFDGHSIMLTQREWLLLKEFMLNKKRVLTREHLESLCFGWDGDTESNVLEVHIHKLRKKISKDVIRTVRGVGYLLGDSLS
ncbi:response regulator [Neptunicella marina]|uniref:Response regulator transcription factor n=1 Tax=Neptunicella marina TaxID=2125989 RepID=A0A8J6M7B8_9ALTE|nr:response regulator transcription factor [Neptunicella marina]MBC3767556.1 response regulator transcription factor [Neptunicella marina]